MRVGLSVGEIYLKTTGYVDESLDGQGWFCLSCVITTDLYWHFFSGSWARRLTSVNRCLLAEGRNPISRFHATDLWARRGEYTGWSLSERDSFVAAMRSTIEGLDRGVHAVCHGVKQEELADVFELANPKQIKRACYAATFSFLMLQLAEDIDLRPGYEHEKVTLVHDQNESYDAAIARAFQRMKTDASFKGRHYFTSLTPCRWQHCVPLQAADYVAYETRRNIPNKVAGRDFGPQLAALLKLPNFGGSSFYLSRANLESVRDTVGLQWLQSV